MIKYSDHIIENGKSFFQVSKEKNLEGIMAKKIDSKYYPGKRTTEWFKIKNHKTQEAIIAGYTQPAGSRKYFGCINSCYLKKEINLIILVIPARDLTNNH